jgi:hypothetical protein
MTDLLFDVNSCLHLEPASQDILEVHLCTPHYQKYNNYETLQSCYICDKTTSNKRSVIMPISKIYFLSSGSFSDLIKAVLSTKSSNVLYKSDNNKALLDKKSLTTNSKTG